MLLGVGGECLGRCMYGGFVVMALIMGVDVITIDTWSTGTEGDG